MDISPFRNVGTGRVAIMTSGSDGRLGADAVLTEGYRIEGTFLGSQAEEASGIFETPACYGSFGVRQR